MQLDAFGDNSRHMQNLVAFCFIVTKVSVDNDTCGEELHAACEGASPNIITVTTMRPKAAVADAVRPSTSMSMILQAAAQVHDVDDIDMVVASIFVFRGHCHAGSGVDVARSHSTVLAQGSSPSCSQ